ncbi:hypothetical protein CBG46_09975 [Actinobacillus succinogenes]|uniref:DUF2570 family protein n=1 Tax=Actinobacillus succinogenes TaxID=67854 RepID=UPI0005A2D534|nr:DUF2570 family protein [Actinobacillus succinogenes]PHI40982.1 hypothetical protein CBG46_09975 [Actinobacillus succinogenes]
MGIGDSLTKLAWLLVLCVVVVFGLCGWIYHQSNKIDNLNAEIETHKQTIATQSSTIKRLKADAEYNNQLTQALSKAESEARSKSDGVIKAIPKQVKASNAFNADAPRNVIEFLRE